MSRASAGIGHTLLGLTQRTVNGRFLYGRVKNYRLARCLACLPNFDLSLGSVAPTAGAAPLAAVISIGAGTGQAGFVPDQQSNWPSPAAGGVTSLLTQGGIAVRGTGYPRVNGGTPIPEQITINPNQGDPADTGETFGGSLNLNYPAGTTVSDIEMRDALNRTTTQELDPVVAV